MSEGGSTANNGVNVEHLIGARTALTDAPEAAQFMWRASCEWKNGTYSHSTVEGFFGLGEEHMHKKTCNCPGTWWPFRRRGDARSGFRDFP